MPQRKADRNNLRVSTPRRRAAIENLEPRELLSSTWFVSPAGNNKNPGTLAAPFQTIQQAATVAQSGDDVEIETGTYHETVTPAHSGVTFEAYNNENVTISGADPITGWTQYSGEIYSAPMSTDLGEGNNQVFVNDLAMNEAEFPNSAIGDASTPTTATMQSVKGNTIYDSALNQPANYWKGAIIHMDPGQAWVDETGTVTSSAPGSITISYTNMGAYTAPTAGNQFQLFGTFKALDTAGEWYRDPTSGRLYLWAPGNANPASLDVEAKDRPFAFNLNNVSGTTINNIGIFSATITTTASSKNTVINGITANYVSHQMLVPNGWFINPTEGILLKGADSVLENSTIANSTSDGVEVSGSGSLVTNNVIHDVDTVGANDAGVRLLVGNVTVSHNTIYNSGRDGVLAEVAHATVTYNTIHDVGLQTTEAGGIYTASVNGEGSTMAYNQIYNIHTAGYGGTALFADNSTSGWSIHNNITWNVDYGLKLNYTSTADNIYDNTLGATSLSINTNQLGSWKGVTIDGNVFTRPIVTTAGASIYNNTFSSTAPAGMGAGDFSSGASGVVAAAPPPVTVTTVTPATTTQPATKATVTPPAATSKIMAVNYTSTSNTKADGSGGVGYIYNNSSVAYTLDFGAGVTKISAGLAAMYAGGTMEIHLGSATGTLLGKINIATTGAWNKYTSQTASITGLKGVQTVYLVFKGSAAGIANIDWLQFS
ncbi:MAG TPA: carbohydrate-binding protein [Tepidisphaeraceae bacterium]|jgi:hypothetical protein|nr:carbohydrate-binding protein [Tepidisphaeraceae bacterium]